MEWAIIWSTVQRVRTENQSQSLVSSRAFVFMHLDGTKIESVKREARRWACRTLLIWDGVIISFWWRYEAEERDRKHSLLAADVWKMRWTSFVKRWTSFVNHIKQMCHSASLSQVLMSSIYKANNTVWKLMWKTNHKFCLTVLHPSGMMSESVQLCRALPNIDRDGVNISRWTSSR